MYAGIPTSGLFWSQWRGKRPQHSRRMRNPRFYVSGKRPIPAHAITVRLGDQSQWLHAISDCCIASSQKSISEKTALDVWRAIPHINDAIALLTLSACPRYFCRRLCWTGVLISCTAINIKPREWGQEHFFSVTDKHLTFHPQKHPLLQVKY